MYDPYLLAAKSTPATAALLAAGVRCKLGGGDGLDQVKLSRFRLANDMNA